VKRAKCKVNKDKAVGWVTLKDRGEVEYAQLNPSLFLCKSSVAITDGEDVKNCKVVRKLAEGELFGIAGAVVTDEATSVSRVEGTAVKDGKKGWITTKGNAGTVFAEAATTIYSVTKEVELTKVFASDGPPENVVRKLEVGETFQVTEGPRDEKVAPEVRVKVKCVNDAAVGWTSLKEQVVKAWSPNYKCLEKVSLHNTCAIEGAKELRELAKGESFELLEGPVPEGGVLRICGQADKDGIVGWVTIKDETGKRFLDC